VKRALFLTYYLPPRPAIASVRAGHIVQAFRACGWEVVALTPEGEFSYDLPVRTARSLDFKAAAMRMLGAGRGVTAHEHFNVTPASRLGRKSIAQRAIEYGRQTVDFANGRFGWISDGVRVARKLLREEAFDVIISTSPPERPFTVTFHGSPTCAIRGRATTNSQVPCRCAISIAF
jgi:hypothetical protein